MILKKGTIADFAQHVKIVEQNIVIYGAGVIGQVAAPYWIARYRLEDRVICYVDADSHKQGQTVQIGTRDVPIRSLSALDEESGRYILLITVSAFEPVAVALEKISGTRNAEAYFLPIMLLDIAHTPKAGGVVKTSETQLIPKKIHYCWFGGNPIPMELQKCMDSWKRFCPDYEIVRWDESNYDIHKSPYMEQAYAHKKWSFVSDFARLDILYRYGGIYLDTDVELLRNLDELLYQPAFCGVEKWGVVNTGICGARATNHVVGEILKKRKYTSFFNADESRNPMSSGLYDTIPLIRAGMRPNGETQQIAEKEMTVYAAEFFHPFDYMSGETRITENTFSIHHFSGSWLNSEGDSERKRTREHYAKFLNSLEA